MQIATINLTDAAVTPVVHAFNPTKVDGDTGHLVNRAPGVHIGYEGLHIRVTPPTGNELYARVSVKLVLPTLEVTAGSTGSGLQAAATKAYDNYIEVIGRFHKRSTQQERKNALAMMVDALQEAIIVAAVHDLENVW